MSLASHMQFSFFLRRIFTLLQLILTRNQNNAIKTLYILHLFTFHTQQPTSKIVQIRKKRVPLYVHIDVHTLSQ